MLPFYRMKKLQKNCQKFLCKKCDFCSKDKNDYKRHLATTKHKNGNNGNMMVTQKTAKHICSCGKKYKHRSGRSRHKRKCASTSDGEDKNGACSKNIPPDVEKEALKKANNDLRTMMKDIMVSQKETVKNFTQTINEIIPKIGHTIHNRMSINVFLNEKCKNAMNLTDFVNKLQVSLEDLSYTRDNGYVKGISNIFVKQLKDMEPTQRPIHCSDKKRLQFYIKDENQWKKDKSNIKLDKSIENITIKQIRHIKIWEREHPNYLQDEKLLTEWHTMIHNVMGSDDNQDRNKNKDSIKKEISMVVEVKNELK